MSDFTPYPVLGDDQPESPDNQYVVAVTCSLDQGWLAPEPISAPMGRDQAQGVLDQIISGQTSAALGDDVDLVAEISPGHLVASRGATLMRKAVTYDIRMARVLFSR